MSVLTNVPLADKNWFKTGGQARFFSQPMSSKAFQEALAFACTQQLPIFMLGQGANILISDEGFDGLVIQPHLTNISVQEKNFVQAQSGVTMDELILFCLERNLVGLEDFSGIPGTVGGSVYINLHYFSSLLGNYLIEATVIERATGRTKTVDRAWFNFGYNSSRLHSEQYYLLSATFALSPATTLETAYARGRRAEIIRHRTARYPNKLTCGSFFRNFFEHEVTLVDNGKKVIWVAYYLDKVGIKGELAIGGARVSYQHANMIVNSNNARSADIIAIARTMQEKVLAQFGVLPQPECRLIGFTTYPLLQ